MAPDRVDLPGFERSGRVRLGPGKESGLPSKRQQSVNVKAIEVEGNKEVATADILQVVGSRIGEAADNDRIQRDLQSIFDTGYFTDVKVRTEPFLNGVRIVYIVLENPKVASIEIEGNKLVSTEKLAAMLETRQGKILNTKTLFSDLTVLNRYYDNELGYLLEPTHVSSLKFGQDGKLKLQIVEGVPVKEIKIVGNTVIPLASLKPLVKMKPGQIFNQFTMKEDADRLSKLYEKRDFILDNIRPSINKADGVVTYQIVEATVEDVRIEGNTRTRGYVIKRLMRSKVGSILRRQRVQRDMERLNASGFFENVNIEPEPGSEAGKVVLVIKAKEQKTGQATLGLGYSGGGSGALRSGVTGAISFSEQNLNGRGQSASIGWQRGTNVDSLSLSYNDPAINDRQDSFGISLFHSKYVGLQQPILQGRTQVYAIYDQEQTGGSVTLGRYLNEDLRGFVTFRKEYLKVSRNAGSVYTPVGLGEGTANALIFSLLSDTRDDVFTPHKGTYLNGAFTLTGGPLGGFYSYTKLQTEVRHYIPVFKDHTIALRGWAGFGNGNLPVSEFFYVGGPDSLRGYYPNSFIGNRFAVANAEYRFPIAKLKILSGAVFVDTGGAWSNNSPMVIKSDAGVGLRITFPSLGLGVIRLDYAIGDQGARSSIGLGQTF